MKRFDLYISTGIYSLFETDVKVIILVRNNNMKRYSISYSNNLIKDFLLSGTELKKLIKESKIYSSTEVNLPESYELLSFNSVDEAIKIIEDSPEIFL